MAQYLIPPDPLATAAAGAPLLEDRMPPALHATSQLTTAEMDVLIGVQRSIPPPYSFIDAPGHVAQHVTSRKVTRQTTQGSTSITETFMEVIMDTWTDTSQGNVNRSQTTQIDLMSEDFWTDATDHMSGAGVPRQVQYSNARQFQHSHYDNVASHQDTGNTRTDQLTTAEMELLTGMGTRTSNRALSRDDESRYQNQNLTGYQTIRPSNSHSSNQSGHFTQVPLGHFVGLDSSHRRDQNRITHQQFNLPDHKDLTGSTSELQSFTADPVIGDSRKSIDRYQCTGSSQFNRPLPNYQLALASTNISSGMEASRYRGQYSTPTPSRTRTVRQFMPYQTAFERNSSTRIHPRNQGHFSSASRLTQARNAEFSEAQWETNIKVNPQEQEESQFVSSQISPGIAPRGLFNQTMFRSSPTSMASMTGTPQAQSQYRTESATSGDQTSQAILSDTTDCFPLAEAATFVGVDTSRYQGHFISAPQLTEHQTQQSNLPDPLTYPFLGATMGQPKNQAKSSLSESNLINIKPNDQYTFRDSSLQIDLEDSNTEMTCYQGYEIPNAPLPEASSQMLQGDLPNPNAYPSLAAAIDALAEMEIGGQQNRFEPGHQSLQGSRPRIGIPQSQNQSQIFDPMSNQFDTTLVSPSFGVQQPQHPGANRGIPSAPPPAPPESERQRVARRLREFLKNSSK